MMRRLIAVLVAALIVQGTFGPFSKVFATETVDALLEIQALLASSEAGALGEDTLLEIEPTLKSIAQDKNDPTVALRAQAYLIDVYSRLAGITPLIPNKRFYSRKADITFRKILETSPDYALGYSIYAVSQSLAPDFLRLHRTAQEHFESALRHIPEKREMRSDDDWDALALVVRFYPPLLKEMDGLGLLSAEYIKTRQAEILALAEQLQKR